jgi:hypothetical protein
MCGEQFATLAELMAHANMRATRLNPRDCTGDPHTLPPGVKLPPLLPLPSMMSRISNSIRKRKFAKARLADRGDDDDEDDEDDDDGVMLQRDKQVDDDNDDDIDDVRDSSDENDNDDIDDDADDDSNALICPVCAMRGGHHRCRCGTATPILGMLLAHIRRSSELSECALDEHPRAFSHPDRCPVCCELLGATPAVRTQHEHAHVDGHFYCAVCETGLVSQVSRHFKRTRHIELMRNYIQREIHARPALGGTNMSNGNITSNNQNNHNDSGVVVLSVSQPSRAIGAAVCNVCQQLDGCHRCGGCARIFDRIGALKHHTGALMKHACAQHDRHEIVLDDDDICIACGELFEEDDSVRQAHLNAHANDRFWCAGCRVGMLPKFVTQHCKSGIHKENVYNLALCTVCGERRGSTDETRRAHSRVPRRRQLLVPAVREGVLGKEQARDHCRASRQRARREPGSVVCGAQRRRRCARGAARGVFVCVLRRCVRRRRQLQRGSGYCNRCGRRRRRRGDAEPSQGAGGDAARARLLGGCVGGAARATDR